MPLIPRTDWAVAPLEGEALITVPVSQRDGFIVHWDGGPTPTTASRELDLLRGYEAYHRRTDGAGGLKYNLAVGPVTGNVYEGRGLDKRGMHTGGANVPNIGCIVIGGPGNLTDAAAAGLREAFAIASSYAGRDLARRVHSDLNQTECPGDELRAFVKGGGIVTPSLPIPISSTVDIGHGRGRLAPNPAASIRRIDAQLGRPADINDAWRSPEQADKNALAWSLYQKGLGPIAPYALDRWGSIHCRGYATDSDDWYNPAAAAVWRRNGWRQTALYPVGDRRREEWHAEYDESRDEFLGQPAGTGGNEFEEDDMGTIDNSEENYKTIAGFLARAFRYDVRPQGMGADWKLGPTVFELLGAADDSSDIKALNGAGDPTAVAKAVLDAAVAADGAAKGRQTSLRAMLAWNDDHVIGLQKLVTAISAPDVGAFAKALAPELVKAGAVGVTAEQLQKALQSLVLRAATSE